MAIVEDITLTADDLSKINGGKKKNSVKNKLENVDSADESPINNSTRAKNLDEIIGRENEKNKLKVLVKSAKSRDDVIDHILFYGPPGLVKTTFGYAISSEFGSNFIFTSGPGISSKAELASIISSLNKGDFLFIDEIHRLNKVLEEFLYPVLEDFQMDV